MNTQVASTHSQIVNTKGRVVTSIVEMRLFALLLGILFFTGRSSAQTPEWTYAVSEAGYASVGFVRNSGVPIMANDSFGGSAWIFQLENSSPPLPIRIVWFDRKGKVVHTEDLPNVDEYEVDLLKLTKTELRFVMYSRTTPSQGILRKVTRTRNGVKTTDIPFAGRLPGNPQRNEDDKFGFFTCEYPEASGSNALIIRRYKY